MLTPSILLNLCVELKHIQGVLLLVHIYWSEGQLSDSHLMPAERPPCHLHFVFPVLAASSGAYSGGGVKELTELWQGVDQWPQVSDHGGGLSACLGHLLLLGLFDGADL